MDIEKHAVEQRFHCWS